MVEREYSHSGCTGYLEGYPVYTEAELEDCQDSIDETTSIDTGGYPGMIRGKA
ncbi:MAG: hypothetical protein DDT32_01246 [Syntrophomonadaceae bacterium]|nr:hypothetical protein [Bacillota bacterium]